MLTFYSSSLFSSDLFITAAGRWKLKSQQQMGARPIATLGVQVSVFERRVSGDTRFCCSAQCAGFVPLGSSFLSLLLRVRNTRRVE